MACVTEEEVSKLEARIEILEDEKAALEERVADLEDTVEAIAQGLRVASSAVDAS